MAICVGEQASYMVKTEPSKDHDPSLEAVHSEQSRDGARDRGSIDRVIRESVEFEEKRYRDDDAGLSGHIQELRFSDAVWRCFAVLWQSGRRGTMGTMKDVGDPLFS